MHAPEANPFAALCMDNLSSHAQAAMLMCRRFSRGLPFARSLATKKKRPAFNPRPNQPLIQPEQSGVANSSDSISGNVTKTPKTDRNPHAAKTKLAFKPRPPSTPPPSKKEIQFKPKPPSSPPPRDLQPQVAGPKRTPGLASATAIVLFGSFFTLSVRFWTYVNSCAYISQICHHPNRTTR